MGSQARPVFSLPDFIAKVVREAEPCSQNTGPGDLGFGWLYYGLVRNLKPDYVVAIGSRRGFTPFCCGRAVQDNGHGRVIFIDPSYAGDGPPGWSGLGLWDDAAGVEGWIASFGLQGWVDHWKQTSADAFPALRDLVGHASLDVVVIDGAHDYAHSLEDFDLYSSIMRNGVALFHDATNRHCEVARTIETLRGRGYPVSIIDRDAGLAIVGVRKAATVEDKWSYLCRPSNRGNLLAGIVQPLTRPGDYVLDAYCGCSPLAALLDVDTFVGWDADPSIVARLRANFPNCRWEAIDEMSVPFSDLLPERVDVLLGLGVSLGYASWDPKRVWENVAYLLGRYYPRVVVFEAAADYHDAEVLSLLSANLARLRYECRYQVIQTDMTSFSRRKVLLAQRA